MNHNEILLTNIRHFYPFHCSAFQALLEATSYVTNTDFNIS